jgi:hypothetical protein
MSTITESTSPVRHENPERVDARFQLPSTNPLGPSWADLRRGGAKVRSIKPSGPSWANLHQDGANVRSTRLSGPSWADLLKR